MLLVGDIGGTKTNLGVYTPQRGPRDPVCEATFSSAQYESLEALAHEYLAQTGLSVEYAAFGVAGPVVQSRATITNLSWKIDEEHLAETLNVRCAKLINDLESIANAVPILKEEDVFTLNAGIVDPQGAKAVLAPGTGLGEAFLIWNGQYYQAQPSEGGHADFAPTSSIQAELWRYLYERYGHVSFERVCSGRGIPNIYKFLRDSGYAPEPPWLTDKLSSDKDLTAVIMNAALDETQDCELCRKTLDVFVSILGAEAGNLALKVMATGGVYLAGGIPPRILPALKKSGLMETFQGKGRMSDVIQNMPMYVIMNPKAALFGAASFGLAFMQA
ncbi:MAG: glucokinase [Deltaproteobacteria bacterium]|nr:glucokinase [Deltaproteobacteria bacterium]